jgi:hypothetical protein
MAQGVSQEAVALDGLDLSLASGAETNCHADCFGT